MLTLNRECEPWQIHHRNLQRFSDYAEKKVDVLTVDDCLKNLLIARNLPDIGACAACTRTRIWQKIERLALFVSFCHSFLLQLQQLWRRCTVRP